MLERFLKFGILAISVFIASYLLYTEVIAPRFFNASKMEKLPYFEFKDINGKVINSTMLRSNKSTLVLHVNINCSHCVEISEGIGKNIQQFSNTNIVIISSAPLNEYAAFAQKLKLWNQPNVFLLSDPDQQFYTFFGEESYPLAFYFDKNQRFVSRLFGEFGYLDVADHVLTEN